MSTTNPVGVLLEVDQLYLLTELVKMQQGMLTHAQILESLKESMDGTMRTKGLREKMAVAEQNIDANKAAFLALQVTVKDSNDAIMKKIDEQTDSLKAELNTTRTNLQKIQPYVNAIAWVVTIAGPIIIGMILSGRWFFGPVP